MWFIPPLLFGVLLSSVQANDHRCPPKPRQHEYVGTVNPFQLGVASGDPTASSVVIWTRLVGAKPEMAADILVDYTVYADEGLTEMLQHGSVKATAGSAHSVHVIVDDLPSAGKHYWYQFRAGTFVSRVGRTKTLGGDDASAVRFAMMSCNEYTFGWWTAFSHVAEEDIDFMLHLGDILYEDAGVISFLSPVRAHNGIEVVTLPEYRERWTLYLQDMDMQAALAAHPLVYVWDDHEVDNNWAASIPEDDQSGEAFAMRRQVATQALYEHLPLRSSPEGVNMQFYKTMSVGNLMNLHVLDTRQYRSPPPCGPYPRANPPVPEDCGAERYDESKTMLGSTQEEWITGRLSAPSATWEIVASSVWLSEFIYNVENVTRVNTDSWDGYPVERQRLIDSIDESTTNVLFVSADWHVNGASNVLRDYQDPQSTVVATELMTTSISGVGPWAPIMKANLPENPHFAYIDGDDLRAGRDVHGYVVITLEETVARADYRVVETIKVPDQDIATVEQLCVLAGNPGVAFDC